MITARQQVEATGVVATAEAMTKGRQRIRFTPDSSLTAGETTPVDWRLILPRRIPQFHPGDRISISARIEPPLPQLLPGGFDFAAHAAKKGCRNRLCLRNPDDRPSTPRYCGCDAVSGTVASCRTSG